jgi:hypothetical protein
MNNVTIEYPNGDTLAIEQSFDLQSNPVFAVTAEDLRAGSITCVFVSIGDAVKVARAILDAVEVEVRETYRFRED